MMSNWFVPLDSTINRSAIDIPPVARQRFDEFKFVAKQCNSKEGMHSIKSNEITGFYRVRSWPVGAIITHRLGREIINHIRLIRWTWETWDHVLLSDTLPKYPRAGNGVSRFICHTQ